jgi:hypothetical protein
LEGIEGAPDPALMPGSVCVCCAAEMSPTMNSRHPSTCLFQSTAECIGAAVAQECAPFRIKYKKQKTKQKHSFISFSSFIVQLVAISSWFSTLLCLTAVSPLRMLGALYSGMLVTYTVAPAKERSTERRLNYTYYLYLTN